MENLEFILMILSLIGAIMFFYGFYNKERSYSRNFQLVGVILMLLFIVVSFLHGVYDGYMGN